MISEAVSPLRRRMIEDMTIRQFGEHTQRDYVRQVREFAIFLGRSPNRAEPEDLRRNLLHILQQLADREGGLRAALKQLGVSAAALVTPMSVGAVAGLGAAFVLAAKQAGDGRETLEKATQGIGRTTSASAAQLDVLARANADAVKVSVSTAQEIPGAYVSIGRIAMPVIGDLTRATSEYARITGQDVPAATAELARMFADPGRGADDLAAKIGGLDDRTRQLIQTQIEQGDRTAAQQTLADGLKAPTDANATSTTGWAAAWNLAAAAAAAAGYWEQAKNIAGFKLGIVPEGVQAALARTERDLASLNNIRAFGTGAGRTWQQGAARARARRRPRLRRTGAYAVGGRGSGGTRQHRTLRSMHHEREAVEIAIGAAAWLYPWLLHLYE